MKKTLTVNLNGKVFNIDEDAYALLDNYLRNLRQYFSKEEGAEEIINDFESRIEELFGERIKLGYEVITVEQVEEVIKKVGSPSDFGPREEDARSNGDAEEDGNRSKSKKKAYRNIDDKIFGGVCSGLAAYTDWDVVAMRIIFAVLILVTSFWIVPLYLILWLIIPPARTAEEKLEMRGEDVSVENIGKLVSKEKELGQQAEKKGCGAQIVDFLGAFLKVCLVALAIVIGIPVLLVLIVILIVFVAVALGFTGSFLGIPFTIMGMNAGDFFNLSFSHPTFALISAIFVVGIPVVVVVYYLIAHFGKLNPVPKSLKWSALGVWILALVVLLSSGFHMKSKNWDRRFSLGYVVNPDGDELDGNGDIQTRTYELGSFGKLELADNLVSKVQIEQSKGKGSKMLVNADSNILKHVVWKIDEQGVLQISMDKKYRFDNSDGIIIKIIAPSVKDIRVKSVGNVSLDGKYTTDDLSVEIEGAGKFTADSLYCGNFTARVDGVGSLSVSGRAKKSNYALEGAGHIDASGLVSDYAGANLSGVGSIKTNPVKKLDAVLDGVGSILYKNEPLAKNIRKNGSVGSIRKE